MNLSPRRTKLIFNPNAGVTQPEPVEILNVLREMQKWRLLPEVFLVEEGADLAGAVADALADGIDLFVVCGGDGTIGSVAAMLAGTGTTLGVLSGGTRNNIALSMGLPTDVADAVAVLRNGRPVDVDMGRVTVWDTETKEAQQLTFFEVCSVGLGSALFPSVDDLQRGQLNRIGDLLSTLISSPPAEITIFLDDDESVHAVGHVVLVTNMPYSGNNYLMGPDVAFDDGLLDVLLFGDLTKLEVLAEVVRGGMAVESAPDPRIQRFQARRIRIEMEPAMPVLVDGIIVGTGDVEIEVTPARQRVLVNDVIASTRIAPTNTKPAEGQ